MGKPRTHQTVAEEWNAQDINTLKILATTTPPGLIAEELHCSTGAVYAKADELGISLPSIDNRLFYKRRNYFNFRTINEK